MINVGRLKLVAGVALVILTAALGQQAPSDPVNFYGVITSVSGGEFQILTNPNGAPYEQERKTVDFDRATAFERSAPGDLQVTRGVQVLGLIQNDGSILATKLVVYGSGQGMLFNAVGRGETQIAETLLSLGVNPNFRKEGRTLLSLAIDAGHSEITGLLISRGADPNAPL